MAKSSRFSDSGNSLWSNAHRDEHQADIRVSSQFSKSQSPFPTSSQTQDFTLQKEMQYSILCRRTFQLLLQQIAQPSAKLPSWCTNCSSHWEATVLLLNSVFRWPQRQCHHYCLKITARQSSFRLTMKKSAATLILTINSYKFPALCHGEKAAPAWTTLVPSRSKLL